MSLEKFNLKSNPFRMTPATNPDEIVWAGFPEIKTKLENRIKRSIKITNSSLILNWGEYGSGKTHAARYFNKSTVLKGIADTIGTTIPYSIVMPLPKGKEPIYNIFTTVIDKLNILEIREKYEAIDLDLIPIIDQITDNMHIRSVLKAIFDSTLSDINLLKKYLYGNISSNELKELNQKGILRQLNSDSDYTKILACLFTCLTCDKKLYSAVIIWLDEFEDLATLNSSSIDKINNFLREIMDNTPNNLLLFLNLTQSAMFGLEDLGEFVTESVRSRIKDRNNFEIPSKEDLLLYLKEIICIYRLSAVEDFYLPFTIETINQVLEDLGNVSLRTVNEAFSLLLEIGDLEGCDTITPEFYQDNKAEIIGWKQ